MTKKYHIIGSKTTTPENPTQTKSKTQNSKFESNYCIIRLNHSKTEQLNLKITHDKKPVKVTKESLFPKIVSAENFQRKMKIMTVLLLGCVSKIKKAI